MLSLSTPLFLTSVEEKHSCDVIYLDFAKAFDTVPHYELLLKALVHGDHRSIVDVVQELPPWSPALCIHRWNLFAFILPVLSGVVQGSILGLLLFLFADDTKIVKSVMSFSDTYNLQEDLNDLNKWCHSWNMSLNVHKCVAVHFSTSSAAPNLMPYTAGDSDKNLGINHYNHICSKA